MDRLRCSSASRMAVPMAPHQAYSSGRQQVGVGKREGFAQRPDDARVLRNRADQSYRRLHRPPLHDGALEVARHGVAQPAQDLRRRVALLLRVDHVALGEHRAAPGDPRRALGRADDPADLLHRVLHAQRLLIEERPGTRRALARPVIVHDAAAIEPDVLRAFPADFEHRAHLRVDRPHHPRDGFELIFEEQPQHFGDGAAARAGYAYAFHLGFGDDFVELLQQVVGGLNGAAGDAPVLGKDQRPRPHLRHAELRVRGAQGLQDRPVRRAAQGGQFETDGPDVQTDIDAHFHPVCARRPAKLKQSRPEWYINAATGDMGGANGRGLRPRKMGSPDAEPIVIPSIPRRHCLPLAAHGSKVGVNTLGAHQLPAAIPT